MISALSWIPKGAAKSIPVEAEPPSQEEIEEILKKSTLDASSESENEEDEDMEIDVTRKISEVSQALAAADAIGKNSEGTNSGTIDITDGLRELNMDDYDNEENGVELFGAGLGDVYYKYEPDPYLKDDDDDEDEEIEDMTIKPSDAVIVCASNEDDVSQLQVCVFEELEDGSYNFYPHHDIILPAFPLCTEWLDFNLKGGDNGNFIAVGSMEPAIEIWDLDLILMTHIANMNEYSRHIGLHDDRGAEIDEVQPCMVLGGVVEKKKKKKKKEPKKVSIKYKKDSHKDSVLGLAWNKLAKKYLASASADTTVKIWDLATGQCFHTREHHTDKVQAVAWNRHVPDVLLSGSFDHSVVLTDMRYPSHTGIRSAVTADVESLVWDPQDQHFFVASLEDGTIQGFDVRLAATNPEVGCKPCFTLHAHDKAVTTLSFNTSAPKLIATGSTDKTVKLWDLTNNTPSCVATNNPKAGAVFSISFSEENPFLLAIGGSKGKLQVWDTLTDDGVARKYRQYSNRRVEAAPEA